MKLNVKNNKGITLIALVVTIVVMGIIAGVTVRQITGEKGLINKVKNEKKEQEDLIKGKENKINFLENELLSKYDEKIEILYPAYENSLNPGEIASGCNKKYISNGKMAIIPEGFAVSGIEGEKTIDEGLVIYDVSSGGKVDWNDVNFMQTTYNQFVWIPVENETEYVRNYTYECWYDTGLSNTPIDSTYSDINYLPYGKFNLKPSKEDKDANEIAERTAVVASKGFYIGRYEAGGTDIKATCKKDAVNVNITQENSKKASKGMYNDQYKASALCSGIQWDMVMKKINGKDDGSNDDVKTYDVKKAKASRHIAGEVAVSGNNPIDKVYNIYDLEGNVYEYVAEKNNTTSSFIRRGGCFDKAISASYRVSLDGEAYGKHSFRPVLYVKEVDTNSLEPGEIVKYGSRKYISNGKTAIIPEGFAVSGIEGEKTIDEGLVIYDLSRVGTIDWNNVNYMQTTYNQYVWIPVEKSTPYIINKNENSLLNETSDSEAINNVLGTFTSEEFVQAKLAEENAVKNAGGFYVGRYEAGKEATDKIVCKKEAVVWNSITYSSLVEESKKIKLGMSALCSDIQWDIIMNTISLNNKLDGNNNPFNVQKANPSRHHELDKSGKYFADKVYNIYDLEDNCAEYVAAKSGDDSHPFVRRGGDYAYSNPANIRFNRSGSASSHYSFRPVLYVK